jgi:WD40 repeat protein
LLDHLTQATSTQTAVVVDQFEELIATASDVARTEVVTQLAQLLEGHAHLTIIFVVRDELYSRFIQHEIFAQWTQRGLVNISPTLTYDEVIAIVHKPATVAGWSFEEGLIETIAEDALTTDSPLASSERVAKSTILPLLEFALTQLWERRDEGMLTHQAYEKIGGVTGGLTQWADQAFYSFEERLRPLVRHMFTSLVHLGNEDQHIPDTRRSRALTSLARTEAERADVSQIVHRLASTRLLVISQDPESKQEMVEIIHEALLREWGLLTQWLAEDRRFLAWHQKLEERVQEWIVTDLDHPTKRDTYKLFGGRDLTEAEDWLAERKADLSQQEQGFIEASKKRQRRELNRLRFFAAALSIFSIIVIILGSLAAIGYVKADQQSARADQQTKRARAEALQNDSRALAFAASAALAHNETDLALLLSIKALQVKETFEARNSLFSALMQSPHLAGILSNGYNYPDQFGPIVSLAFGEGGQTLYAYNGSQIFRWMVQTHSYQQINLPVTDSSGSLGTIVFSPDNRTLGVVNGNGIWLIDLQTTTVRPPLAPPTPGLSPTIIPRSAITFSHDGALVAASRCHRYPPFHPDQPSPPCAESAVSIWNTQSAQPTPFSFTVKTDIVGLAFSPDEKKLAIASPTDILVAATTTSQQIVSLPMNNAVVTGLAFSPDGTKLAASSEDRTIHLWDAASWEPLASFSGHEGIVFSIAFSHNGKILASASQDGTIRLWSVGTGNELGAPLTGHREQAFSVAFSPDDKMLASGGQDGSIMLWNIDAEGTINRRLADTYGGHSALFSPDGKTIFTGTDDGRVLLLDSSTGELQATLGELSVYPLPQSPDRPLAAIESIALSGNGKVLAAGKTDGTIFLWDLKTQKVLPASPLKYPGHLSKVMLNADGHLLAAGGDGGVVMLWNVGRQSNASVFHVDSPPDIGAPMALSSDGKLLAAGNCSTLKGGNCPKSEILLWAVGVSKLPTHVLLGQRGPFLDVAFNPNGRALAASGLDGIKLWDTTKQTLITTLTVATPASELGLYYQAIHFSPDGKQLLSSSGFGKPIFVFAIWNVLQQELLVQPFSETVSQGSLAFSPDSQRLVSVFLRDKTNIVLLWDITPSAWQSRGCAIAHRNLTRDEWNQFVKDEQQRIKVCTDFPVGT